MGSLYQRAAPPATPSAPAPPPGGRAAAFVARKTGRATKKLPHPPATARIAPIRCIRRARGPLALKSAPRATNRPRPGLLQFLNGDVAELHEAGRAAPAAGLGVPAAVVLQADRS